MANDAVATLAAILLLLGSDLSYIAAVLFHDAPWWDGLVWSTNWMTAGAELLYFNPWAPALTLMFLGFWALVRDEEPGRTDVAAGLLTTAAISFALLTAVKPFAYVVVMGGLVATALVGRLTVRIRLRLLMIAGGAVVFALPLILPALTLYEESQSILLPGSGYLTVLPHVVVAQLDLERVMAHASGGNRALAAVLGIVAANVLFFTAGLGVRLAGIGGVWRSLRAAPQEPTIWKLLAWTIVIGGAIPLVVVTEPYHQTFMWTQASLFLLWIFVARFALTPTAGAARFTASTASAACLIVIAAIPSTVHYLDAKWSDSGPPFWTINRDLRAVADVIAQQDPEQTVVLHRSPHAASVVPLLTGRRVLLAWSSYVRNSNALADDIERFFQSTRGGVCDAWSLLTDLPVTHVLETRGDHIHPRIVARLRLLAENGSYRLYEVPPDVRRRGIGNRDERCAEGHAAKD
jgi:hypothetical protein